MSGDCRAGHAPSRLVRLELQGFKSFASRTVFAFEPGITAVVGPNGSGKSNIADAVRWVLGEQGYGALRAKRTDDVIFAGGQGRAPAGMAEASLTFDNHDRWLPIDFAEVTVTRRAFRGGETQYLINGRRVRLKDVALLTASLGQSHVVVGQGLVDAALSQRAEERRGLFEHAADLSGLRLVGDDDHLRFGGQRAQLLAEPDHVRLVQRGVDLVQQAERGRVDPEDRDQQRRRRQRPLAPGQQRQALQPLARRLGDDVDPGRPPVPV
jgi:chromosome segregation protein